MFKRYTQKLTLLHTHSGVPDPCNIKLYLMTASFNLVFCSVNVLISAFVAAPSIPVKTTYSMWTFDIQYYRQDSQVSWDVFHTSIWNLTPQYFQLQWKFLHLFLQTLVFLNNWFKLQEMDYLLNVNAGYGITWLLSWQRTEVQKPGMDLLGGGGGTPLALAKGGQGGGGYFSW